jgi:hypothetical protein
MNIGKKLLQLAKTPLIGFGGKRMNALGKIPLPVSFSDRTTHTRGFKQVQSYCALALSLH